MLLTSEISKRSSVASDDSAALRGFVGKCSGSESKKIGLEISGKFGSY